MQLWKMDFVTRTKKPKKILKKVFKIKLLEICKIRAKTSSPDMFNFYVVLAGHYKAGLARAGENSQPHHYKQKVQN